jgi:hypothetical protein
VPDERVRLIINDVVLRVHRITMDATELLSLHLTRCLNEGIALPIVTNTYIKTLMMEVSRGAGTRKRIDTDVEETRKLYMPYLVPVDRKGIDQVMAAQAISIAASFQTNLWFHFSKRITKYVRCLKGEEIYQAESTRQHAKLRILRIADYLCSGREVHVENVDAAWIEEQRVHLGIQGFTYSKPEMNVKKHANEMLFATWKMNQLFDERGLKNAAICPLRRCLKPCFCNLDTKAVCACILGKTPPAKMTEDAKVQVWREILDLNPRAIRGMKKKTFAGSIKTDGISVRLLFKNEVSRKRKTENVPSILPRRGLFSIDQIKHLSRTETLQIIGADPGKRELLVCADEDENGVRSKTRYTAPQRRRETQVRNHAVREQKERPDTVNAFISSLSDFRSKSPYMPGLSLYFTTRRSGLDEALTYFALPFHRRQAWERHVLSQKSLTDFVRRVRALGRTENHQVAIAYGSWAAIAGRPGSACNKGAPSCLGKGLRSKLADHFLVISTPEAYTSKTCSKCGSLCGPCEEVDAFHRNKKLAEATTEQERRSAFRFSVRGLRHCHNEECGAHLNRDLNAAVNISRRCKAFLSSQPDPIRYVATSIENELDEVTRRLRGE